MRANRADSESSPAKIHGDAGKAGFRKAPKCGARANGSVRASDVAYVMNPAVSDLEGKKDAGGTEYTKRFFERAVLQFG